MTESEGNYVSRFFPGSTTPLDIAARKKEVDDKSANWDLKPLYFTVRGEKREFFSIGALALALGNRSTNTIRKWEQEGILPKSIFVKPSQDPRGRRRMYTRGMVEGLVEIAREEGVLYPDKGKRLSFTGFTKRAVELFKKENTVGR